MIADGKQRPGPERTEDLYDGAVFSDLLEILDDQYNPSELQANLANTRPVENRRRNLHVIHLALRSLVRTHCADVEMLINDINFQALDKEPQNEGMSQILAAFLVASVNLADKDLSRSLLQHMQSAPQDAQTIHHLWSILKEAQDKITRAKDTPSESNQASSGHDDELAREAEIVRLRREYEHVKRQGADYKTQYDRLLENHAELVERQRMLQQEKDDLATLVESSMLGSEQQAGLRKELKEKIDLIDQLEAQLHDTNLELHRVKQVAVKLEAEVNELTILKDENQELRMQNDVLSKKANAAAHLKQKLEKLTGLEKEIVDLRKEKNEFYESQMQFINAEKVIAQYRAESDSYAQKIHAYEVQVHEYRDQKTAWTLENQRLQRQIESLDVRAKHDEELIRELQEKNLLSAPGTPSAPAHQTLSLEDELRDTNEPSLKDLEVSRLQAEIALLKSSIGTETEKGQLLQEIENERESRRALQDKFNELFEKHTVGEHSLSALINNMSDEGNDAYSNMQKQMLTEENRANQLARELEAAQAEIKDKERDVLEARSDLEALTKGGQDVLAELKQADGMLAVSLRSELDALRRSYKDLKSNFDSKLEQLVTAFIEKDKLRKDNETATAELQKAADGQYVDPNVVKTTEKMEKLRARYKKLSEQLEKSEQSRHELDKMLKAVRDGTAGDAQKIHQDQIIKNLQRENAMIASAWYDLSNRLQSNHVVLQRRNDAPKSWLNKQRQMVNGEIHPLLWQH
ncbi:uncharacterized protein BCR38DRAFT_343864 [Pseudomassariella vexata]|uniref:HOOK N-terminal domain-containing protein n=1 Tax=Pseudomassariella vexata TaxID=1141098 RepID=A0A1Y2DYK2_9PEZI|nr:uncharacterized protein BCR38DRAFT_343864 [Pseudomassariella vexata]ORY64289.1 hypothetical protein BCR38DRAFT_343864 [Pseudomassariella vexata]